MKIYIAGCGGMLGEAFYHTLKNKHELGCSDIDVNENWLHYLDFRDCDSYMDRVGGFNPQLLVHMGAHTDLEYCEKHPEDTYMTNTLSVENAVRIANGLGAILVYIGTAGIFDGQQDVYDDWAQPNPGSIYAKSKYLGERYVVENANRYYVFRAGWMMGGGYKDKKFIKKMIDQIKEGKKILHVVNDKNGTPTYTYDFTKNVELVLNKSFEGVYNMVCEGNTSRLEIAQFIVEHLGLKNEVKIKEVGSDYFSKEYFAPRPDSERLTNYKLNLRGWNIMRDWRVALAEYLDSGVLF